jgi:diguanylate cyclase (GGDEF)-like protein
MRMGWLSRLSSHERRSSSAWAMSLLLLGGGLRCLVGIGTRAAAGFDATVVTTVGATCLLLAVVVFAAGSRCPRLAVYVLLGLGTAVPSLLVATSLDRADIALSALTYPWASLYAAHFLSRRAAYVYACLASAGFAVGIVASGQPGLFKAWALVTGTVFAVTVVTSVQIAALHRLSETDPLTGIANRAGFRRLAEQALAGAERRQSPAVLVLCDVDGLKLVNDASGHAAGDALLTSVAASWRSALRAGDVLARLGGDEFVVLLPGTDASGAENAVARLRAATDVSFSAGVATWIPGTDLDALLAAADADMYASKPRSSRVRTVVPAPRRPGSRVGAPRPEATFTAG